MNKTCARCEKTVYPTEELKCLDKAWHKGCFKCQECGMTLNMRTYKGYGKLPYCESISGTVLVPICDGMTESCRGCHPTVKSYCKSHVPKAKHTTMAETPELKRIAENTKLQSNVNYHADFEKSKGKLIQVADDPETLRIKANTRIISNVAYHGELEKKAQMEKQRQINENGEIVDVATDYHQQIDNYATEMLPPPHLPPKNHYQTPVTQYQTHTQSHLSQQNVQNHAMNHNINQTHYPPQHQIPQHQTPHHQTPHHQNPQHQSSQHQSSHHQSYQNQNQRQYDYKPKDDYYQYQQEYQYGDPQQKIGKIQDYNPEEDGPRAPLNIQRASSTVVYNSSNDKRGAHHSSQHQAKQIGRVTDYDPMANELPHASNNHHQPPPPAPAPLSNQKVYIAMYDYEANDNDEVSFREGDLISNVSSIDEGWMTGQVMRTGRQGMLPANYVAECPQQQY